MVGPEGGAGGIGGATGVAPLDVAGPPGATAVTTAGVVPAGGCGVVFAIEVGGATGGVPRGVAGDDGVLAAP